MKSRNWTAVHLRDAEQAELEAEAEAGHRLPLWCSIMCVAYGQCRYRTRLEQQSDPVMLIH
jgi:hypothetical protein